MRRGARNRHNILLKDFMVLSTENFCSAVADRCAMFLIVMALVVVSVVAFTTMSLHCLCQEKGKCQQSSDNDNTTRTSFMDFNPDTETFDMRFNETEDSDESGDEY